MNIQKMSAPELKALAYDMLLQIQTVQNNLATVNQEIASRKPNDNIGEVKEVKDAKEFKKDKPKKK